MKHKSKAFDKFLHYKNFVKKQTNHQIKILRFDHGGEYKSNVFNNFCQQEGIKREFINVYTL
jgi:hypothetical protein